MCADWKPLSVSHAGATSHHQETCDDDRAIDDWQAEYAAHLAANKAGGDHPANTNPVAARAEQEPQEMEKEESWNVQYAAYCAEKESGL